ncbi:MAG: BatA and WFA domain-containing protein [Bacteroidales bacterium]|jgi:hypothetical protein|nr:BatA and WFA domain-containing protein [Bacteroidales bacterium]
MKFLYPYFLWGLLAVIIPVLIHLFNLRRFKKIYFTNVSALQQAQISTRKQNKLKNLLLLLVRCLAIIFLALLFAQPYIDNGNQILKEGKTSVLIFVDNSFSMGNAGQNGRLLDEAKATARQIADKFGQDDEFMLLTMDMEGRHKHFVNKEQFISSLNEVQITPKSGKISRMLTECQDLLAIKNYDKRLFVLSDFQKSESDISNIQNDSLPTYLVPIEANNLNNVYIDSVWFSSDFIRRGQNIEITARITNWADKEAEKIPVKLHINGKQVAITSTDFDAKQSKNVTMSFVLNDERFIRGKVSILDNPVTFDDDFFFSFTVEDKIKVAIINGKGENKSLERLFNSSASEVSLTQYAENNIDYNSLPAYSVIILNKLQQFTSGLTTEIDKFCNNGGTIVIIPDKEMNLASYRKAMADLSIAAYDQAVNKENKASVVNDECTLYKGVFEGQNRQEKENMEMPKVANYFTFQRNNVSKESIIKMQTGDDFLCMSRKQRGKAYIFSSALDEQTTDFVSQSLFVPTLWNMILFSNAVISPYYVLGENSFIDLTPFNRLNTEIIRVESQDKRQSVIAQIVKNDNHIGIKLNNQIKTAGIYDISADSTFATIALNYNRDESKLEFFSANQIKNLLNQRKINLNVLSSSASLDSFFKQGETDFSFTALLICLIIICLAIEAYILLKKKKIKS